MNRFLPDIAALLSMICLVLAFASCGDDSSNDSSAAAQEGKVETTKQPSRPNLYTVKGSGPKPKIVIPPGPPPKNLVVEVLKRGSGPGARLEDGLGVRYVGVNWATKEVFEDRWNDPSPFSFGLGAKEVRDGWEIGLQGMKLGGRRELILPSRLAYGTGALVYVVELLELERH